MVFQGAEQVEYRLDTPFSPSNIYPNALGTHPPATPKGVGHLARSGEQAGIRHSLQRPPERFGG